MNEQGRDALVSIPLEVPKRRSLDRRFGFFNALKNNKTKQLRVPISTSLCKKAILVIALLLVPGGVLFSSLNSRTAYAAPSNYLNFQARLLTNVGNLVPDGTYNIEFKLYKSLASGASAQGVCVGGVTDDCEWLETRTGANKVSVTNGYFSVNLGSVTAFGGSIDWSQQQFLTMNIGGTGSPSWDGEMTPRIQLTSVPLAFVANNVASGNTSTPSAHSGNISIQTGNATGTTSNSGNISLDSGTATGTTGTISLGATNASSLLLGRASFTTTNVGNLTVQGGTTTLGTSSQAGSLVVSDGSSNTATLSFASSSADVIYELPAASAGTYGICTTAALCSGYASSTSAFVQGGNSFGATALLGTSDNHDLEIGTNSNTALTIDTSQNATFAGNLAVTGTTSLYGQTNISFNTAASGDWGLDSGVTVFDPTTSIGDYYGGLGDALFASNGNALSTATATLTGLQGLASNIAAGETIPLARGVNGQVGVNGDGSTTITTGAALYASNAITAAGVITNNYGLYVQNQTAGTSDYGVYVAGADTYALFVDSGITRLDGDLTVGGDATFQGNLSVSAGKYISLAGGNTASRPGSPTEGMIYFDTTTKQLLTYANGKWQADRSTSTKIVAASTSSQAVKDSADYVATGSSDQTTINTALTAAAGGKVYLAEGTYYDSDRIQIPNNTTLAGAGKGTEIQFTNLSGASKNMIENTDTSTGTGVVVRDLMLNGRSDINTTGSDDGIYFAGMGGGTGGSARQGGQILNIWAEKFTEAGIYLNSSNSYNAIIGNTMVGGLYGIRITSGSYNNVTGNTVMGTTAYGGIFLHTATYNTVSGNTTQGNSSGIYLLGGSNNTITGNTSQGNSGDGIAIGPSTDNTITGNTTVGNGGNGIGLSSGSDNNSVTGNYSASNVYGVFLNSASKNAVSGNTLKSNTYGIRTETSSSDSVTGNAIQDSTTYGIWVRATTDSTFSSNNISNSNGASNNNGIYIEASSTTNSFTSNTITDSSCTSTCYAINIQSGSNYNYLADNNYRTTAGTDQATINDAGTGTKYASQLTPAQILQSGSSLIKANATSVLTGSIDPAASTTVPGVGTKFTTELQIGDRITVTGETRTVTTIASDTSLTVDTAFSNNANDTSPDRLPAALVVQNSSGVNKLVIDDSGLATFSNDVTIVGSNLKFDAVSSGNPMITFDTGGGNIVTLQGERAYGDRLNLVLSGGGVGYGLKVTGNTAIFSNTSTTAFEIQNAGGTPLLTADTSAYKLTVDGDVVISAGKSLKITGGNTASRPGTTACTAEGMVYYDTTTHQLLVCTSTGGKWQADRTEAIIVAASNSSQADKDAADYVADGNTGSAGDGDQVQINAALSAASGRKVVLLAGTYVADETILIPNNTTLAGVGRGTLIELADLDATENLIENSDTSTGTGVVIRDLRINGRNDLNTAGTQYGILLYGMGSGSSSSARQGGQIQNTTILNFRDYGIAMNSSSNNIISGNTVQGNVSTGIRVESSSSYNTITDNVTNGNGVGILVYNSSTNNTVSGNTAQGNSATGIAVWGAINNTVSGNNAGGNGTDGISVSSDKTTISGNTTSGNTQYGINVSSSYNSVTSNTVTGSTYGIWITGTYNSITGNTVQGNSNSGIRLEWSNNVVSGNGVYDNGGATTNSGILLVNSSTDYNTITGNNITDSSCTTDCYAINILAGDKNYLSGNRFIGSAANAASISDLGTNTIYEGQQVNTTTSTNSDLSDFRFRGSADSATAFAVQNAAGTSVLNIDTSADKITVGTSDTTGTLLVLDTKTGSGDPSGVNGAMYYNSNAGKFRCYEASAWKDCDTGGAGSGVTTVGAIDTTPTSANGARISGSNIFMQYGDGTYPGLISTTAQTIAGDKTFTGALSLFKNSSDSATAFAVQKAGSATNVLTVDTSTSQVILRTSSATSAVLQVQYSDSSIAMELRTGAVGSGDIFLGHYSGDAITSGTSNIGIGDNTLSALTTGVYNIAIGVDGQKAATGDHNVSLGTSTLSSASFTGSQNTAIGSSALLVDTIGDQNTALGYHSLYANQDGSRNVGIGSVALAASVSGDGNVALGYYAGGASTGSTNVFIGDQAASNLTAGSGNIFIGAGISAANSTGSDQLNIGNSLYGDLANFRLAVGTSTTTAARLTVDNAASTDSIFVLNDNGSAVLTVADGGETTLLAPLTVTNTITDSGSGQTLNVTLGNDANADTIAALTINATGASTGDADTLYGINIADLTTPTAGVNEYALNIGLNWDKAILAKGLVTVGSTTDNANIEVFGDIIRKGVKKQTSLTNITDIYVYDTTRDSDGGAWTDSFTSRQSSWYSEGKDDGPGDACVIASDDRCGDSDFPKKAAIVSTPSSVYIFDLSDNKLFMKFDQNSSGYALGADTNNNPSGVFALNGTVYVGANGSSGGGLYAIDFINDKLYNYDTTDRSQGDKDIANRNTAVTYNVNNNTAFAIANNLVNDVHGAVINGAAAVAANVSGVNGATVIVVATDASASAINLSSQKVVDYADTATDDVNQVWLTRNGILYLTNETLAQVERYNDVTVDNTDQATPDDIYDEQAANTPNLSKTAPTISTNPDALQVIERASVADENTYASAFGATSLTPKGDLLYVGHSLGLTEIHTTVNATTTNIGWSKFYTTTTETGYMNGTPRAMFTFDNASGDITDASIRANVLEAKGTPTYKVDGVHGMGMSFNGTSQYACSDANNDATCDTDADFDPALISFTIEAWFKHSSTISGTDTLIDHTYTTAPALAAGYRIYMNSSGQIVAGIDDDGTAFDDDLITTVGNTYADNQWHHVVFQRVSTALTLPPVAAGIYLYIDGRQVGADNTIAATLTLNGSAILGIGANCSVGAACATGANFWDGQIDDVYISMGGATSSDSLNAAAGAINRRYIEGRNAMARPSTQVTDATTTSSTTIGDSGSTFVANSYIGEIVEITSGTGAGQTRKIVSNTSTTFTVYPAWTTTPDTTSDYEVMPEQLYGATNSVTSIGVTDTDYLGRPSTVYVGTSDGSDGGGVTVLSGYGNSSVSDVYHADAGFVDDNGNAWTGTDSDDVTAIEARAGVVAFGSLLTFNTQLEERRLDQWFDNISNAITTVRQELQADALNGSSAISGISGADLAERYSSTDALEPGDLVELDPNNVGGVLKATGSYNKDVIGIVATQPGLILGPDGDNMYNIALVGRVPVKVTNENGEIKAGDRITSSTTDGYGMKATESGRVVGAVLDDFTEDKLATCPVGTDELVKCGKVTVFVNLVDYTGDGIDLTVDSADQGGLLFSDSIIDNLGVWMARQQDADKADQQAKADKVLRYLVGRRAGGKEGKSELLTDKVATGTLYAQDIFSSTLTVDKLRANQIEGLDIFTNRLASLQARVDGQETPEENVNEGLNLADLVIDNATINLDLNINGALVVGGKASFHGNTFFYGLVTFVEKSVFKNDISLEGHFLSGGEAPEAKTELAAGITTAPEDSPEALLAKVQVEGNDNAGEIKLTTGEQATIGKVITITFKRPFVKAPRVFLTATNDDASSTRFFVKATADGFSITFKDAQVAGSEVTFNYWVIQ